ncbi:hypothetical protein XI06_14095 [Bradyrhizobium sp. CCBAU 11434]|uniref:hypothetical protein n=1 Tax=Bradyrhizobium sp. CCBAU 11434 TaxID=1630885 RepID=UPI002306ACC4|nr:hypothetical protein [Bradyrhizobium sp. CCBAU 11434]MDA9521454.1 hypothetical protein [Bradyrhizobium sp. CCBAU 11434]
MRRGSDAEFDVLIARNRKLQALLFAKYDSIERAARAGELIDAADITDAKMLAAEIAASREELARMVEAANTTLASYLV